MADYEVRLPPLHHGAEWQTSLLEQGNEAGPSMNRVVRSSTSSSSFSSRRRSAAVNAPPSGPPPDLPMPNIPNLSEMPPVVLEEEMAHAAGQDELDEYRPHPYAHYTSSHAYQRQTASPQLAAVAAFSQSRLASSPSPNSNFNDNLSDSPPRSLLPRSSQAPSRSSQPAPRSSQAPPRSSQPVSQEIVPDRLLLSPPETKSPTAQSRPSSRRVLTRALELAREAVRLDSTNDDPRGAIKAYGESVTLLNEVMERVMRGEDTGEHRRRNGRRRSIVAQEEEVRRLKSIHDTYADRMNILSLIYAIPASPNLPNSNRSDSPSSQVSRETPTAVSETDPDSVPRQVGNHSDNFDVSISQSRLDAQPPVFHDFTSNIQDLQRTSSLNSHANPNGSVSRLRSSSNLPPRPPVPAASPPQTPSDSNASASPSSPHFPHHPSENVSNQQFGHKRMGSGSRVEALREEAVASTSNVLNQNGDGDADSRRGQLGGHRYTNQESPPLPALPPEASHEEIPSPTPRVPTLSMASRMSASPPRSQSPAVITRPRGGSTLSVMSEASTSKSSQSTLINESPVLGTISQRRSKSSTSSTLTEVVTADSPTDSILLPKRLTGPTLPPSIVGSLIGRNRAASQPVRSSGITTPISTSGHSTPSQHMSVPAPRKTSSAFRQSPQPQAPQSAFLINYTTPTSHGPTLTLIPPPPVLPGHLPITPTSPLPPLPPNDPLRKPYHLMSLLRHTMVSKSGGYITRKLHVPYEVWSQGGAKLTNLIEKVRVVEVLCDALLEVQNASVEFCGPMGVANGMGLGVGSVNKKEGDQWIAKLEEFLVICDNVVGSFGKKLGVGEGFVVKKSSGMTSWGNKFARRLDKLTNGKNLDSPMSYVQGLTRLFQLAQLLDEHTLALNSQPMAPTYAALASDLRMAIELKLKRASEFFASVVLTFIIRDLSALLDKYAKKGEKWLAE